jgi:hypothetical protein
MIPKSIEAGEVFIAIFLALLPGEITDRMCLTISNADKSLSSLLYMPDHLLHDHQVPKMRVAGWHKPGHHIKGFMSSDCICYLLVIAVPEDYTASDKFRDLWKQSGDGLNPFNTKLGMQTLNINRLV